MSAATFHAVGQGHQFLRRVLLADGMISGTLGILFIVLAGPMADYVGLSTIFLRLVGLSLLPFSVSLLLLAGRLDQYRSLVWAIVGLNAVWVLASMLLLVSGWVDPTTIGIAVIIVQAIMVAGFAELQYIGLRRAE